MNKLIRLLVVFLCGSHAGNIMAVDPLSSKYGQLVFTTLVYRHGNRSFERTYETDPYVNESKYWPMGLGELAPIGIQTHYMLGKWLRNRYSGFLPELHNIADVYVQSSDFDRTIMSAQVNLAGLYPAIGEDGPDKVIDFQPIPIHTIPQYLDNMLSSMAPCPKFLKEYDKLFDDSEVQQFYAQYKSMFEYIKNHSHLEMGENAFKSTTLLNDVFSVELQFNYKLPEWTESIFPEPLLTVVKRNIVLLTRTLAMKRLRAGALIYDIVNRMVEKKNRTLTPDRIMWIYSAHDSTIINLLDSMQLYNYALVPYAALLMFELRLNSTGSHVITLSYRNTSSDEPFLLHVPGCDSVACELDQFIDIVRPVMVADWVAECNDDVENNWLDHTGVKTLLIIAVFVVVLLSYGIATGKIKLCFRGPAV